MSGLRVEFTVPRLRKKRLEKPKDPVPRIARLLALAHKWEGMVRLGEVKDYAEIARLMGLSRARVSQISSLALLTPSIQEAILASTIGYSWERALRPLADQTEWSRQQACFLESLTSPARGAALSFPHNRRGNSHLPQGA